MFKEYANSNNNKIRLTEFKQYVDNQVKQMSHKYTKYLFKFMKTNNIIQNYKKIFRDINITVETGVTSTSIDGQKKKNTVVKQITYNFVH